MKIIAGLTAFTDFVQQNLRTQLQILLPSITDIEAQSVYMFHNTNVTLYKNEANQLLNDGVVVSLTIATAQQIQLVVTPRVGTVSPWSTKAGDIFKNCALFTDTVTERVEKAVLVTLSFSHKPNLIGNKLPLVVEQLLYDCMTQSIFYSLHDATVLFRQQEPQPLNTFDVVGEGKQALENANIEFGFALSANEIDYLTNSYVNEIKRNPTDTELMMFAQANSEHCRHKIFNSEWNIDGEKQSHSLFGMIKNTYKKSPENVLSAYKDNSSVISGHKIDRFYPQVNTNNQSVYNFHTEQTDILMKVETHNHPTGIAPFAGAATGSGGEIRDEGATGRGSKPKAGLTAFNVSHLHIPNIPEPWEQNTKDYGTPSRMATSLEIMTQAPLGCAAFNNEFGRPALNGYFRSFQLDTHSNVNAMRGYHKPIMLAGGYGNISHEHVQKNQIEEGDLLIVLGGPSMLIGLGGGAASSVDSGAQSEDLDFASVQRDNPEMERRCQEVIDACWACGDNNPIISVHDVGAGGISNAMPELVNDAKRGAVLELRKVPSLENGMSPMEIWSNEAQERYVLAISPSSLDKFTAICERERCPFAVLGEATDIRHLIVNDTHFANKPVDMPMQVLLGGTPRMSRSFERVEYKGHLFDTSKIDIKDACLRVLRQPTVASKSFLISIGDRSVTGMVARDQYVGRYQVPVADCAVTTTGLDTHKGEAMSLGERPPVALLNPSASARLAVGEAITNIASARISTLSDVKMSANWMAAAGQTGEDQALYDAVHTIGMELCPKLGIAIPVGKDSLSMHTKWQDTANDAYSSEKSVTSPMTVVITAFAPVTDVTKTLTPELKTLSQIGESHLVYIDLGRGKNRLAGSILAQVYNQIGGAEGIDTPDLDNADDLINFFSFIQKANENQFLSAYHDIGDGGLFATLSEMQFTSRLGVSVELKAPDILAQLFAEELGAVMQVSVEKLAAIQTLADTYKLTDMLHVIGTVSDDFDGVQINQGQNNEILFDRVTLQEAWASVSYQIQRLRDNPSCADEEFALIADDTHKGLIAKATYDLDKAIEAPYINKSTPKVAILREQGVNGQLEMAASFVKVGFEAVDVHMSDLMAGRVNLDQFNGLVACGGFSYGDVLGAGGGWAKSILFNEGLREQFAAFFERDTTFTLGVCNGCQMLSQLKELIPGGANLPRFRHNTSARFEARTVNVRVDRSKSILLDGMGGSILPIVVAHGEGRLDASADELKALAMRAQIGMRYVDSNGKITQHYPLNPNGSPNGITGLCSEDGRVTMMMPHPERNIRALNHSWKPDDWQQDGAWLRMFRNARVFVG